MKTNKNFKSKKNYSMDFCCSQDVAIRSRWTLLPRTIIKADNQKQWFSDIEYQVAQDGEHSERGNKRSEHCDCFRLLPEEHFQFPVQAEEPRLSQVIPRVEEMGLVIRQSECALRMLYRVLKQRQLCREEPLKSPEDPLKSLVEYESVFTCERTM